MKRHSTSGGEGAETPLTGPITLPSPDTRRWVARRKAEVVAAVQAGMLPLDEALRLYRLTLEEFSSWQRALLRHGLAGLKASQLHHHEADERQARPAAAWTRVHG